MESPCECGIGPTGSISHGVSYVGETARHRENELKIPKKIAQYRKLINSATLKSKQVKMRKMKMF